jgi:myogenesis-regulating glycosidase
MTSYSSHAYLLTIDVEPFGFSLCRGPDVLLRSQPFPETLIHMERGPSISRFTFPSGRLTLEEQPNTLLVRWETSGVVANAFPLTGHWYGQGELCHQLWPLERAMLPEHDLQTMDNGGTGLLCIQTPAWLCSHGVVVLAHSPVNVSLNRPPRSYPRYAWDLGPGQAPFRERPWADPGGQGDGCLTLSGANLTYEILVADDLPAAYHRLIARLGHPATIPPADLFTRPTWTTWARYKTEVSQSVVLRFAQEIIDHRYPYHVMEIDDRWQIFYGDLGFDPARFPDPKGMVAQLHALGFKVTVWVIPFLDPRSAAFAEGAARGFLVRAPGGEPYLIHWWQGDGGLLDVTSAAACDWFLRRLRALQAETGLDGFKFDAGEAIFVPPDAVTAEPLATRNDYTHRYVNFVAQHFALTEVRSGWQNQAAPIFFRQWDKTTVWGPDNGLRSVIPGLLSLSLTGYPFVLPDMVGGNAYAEAPDAELMIRWTQLNALLPAMQFSLAPWDYGEVCADLCRRYAELHLEFAPLLLRLAAEAARTGDPIIRPVFWQAAHAEAALLCDDEYLVGDDWLVAPVVNPGQSARDIYLPPGQWRDYWTGQVFAGGVVLMHFAAPLETLPLFQRFQ